MKITFYGTAAGEGWPGVFCHCQLCQDARRLKGKNIRTRSQTLVNEDLLLDLPPDNQLHSIQYGLDLSKIRTLLFTHSHSDHCYPYDLELLREPYSHSYSGVMQVYGNEHVEQLVVQACGSLGSERERFLFQRLDANVSVQVDDYQILPLRATHSAGEQCLFYRISQAGKAILYAHDTGAFSQENIESLRNQPGRLSLVSLDCTAQKHRDGKYHMGLMDAVDQKTRLIDAGLADEQTIWVVNHFSHNGGWLHDEMACNAERFGFLAAYDGMSIEF